MNLSLRLALCLACLMLATAGSTPGWCDDKAPANRLAGESSPYLLQHAHNPVDWYPWGEEALARAKREKKPIMLSIGYSSCHWCHVMERESFLDKEIAALLNKHFVCIKVDREERPDIDTIYMTALQIYLQLTGSRRGGGWPLTMFLTPDAEPFFGGTYFPARDGDRGPSTGFLTIIQRIAKLWEQSPERIGNDAKVITRFVKQELEKARTDDNFQADAAWLSKVQSALADQFDPDHGGFGFDPDQPNLPKFPEPGNLLFLIRMLDWHESNASPDAAAAEARKLLTVTLDHIARGGIRDHLGGGFHRYSVDRYWAIPHFEKMLYDNGLLASIYAEAYSRTKREEYRHVVEQLAAFVAREMTSPEGGFYAALDAESEGVEGKFYRWRRQEALAALGEAKYAPFAAGYGLDGEPNFEAEFYAPLLPRPVSEIAKQAGMTEPQWRAKMTPIRQQLLLVRSQRPRPLTDTKILTGWNGLMIRGLADAGRVLNQPQHVEAAERAAQFVLDKLRTKEGRLLRTYGRGQAKLNGYVDDYAYLVRGMIGLHQATGKPQWLTAAQQLTDLQIQHFWDDANGGFFYTSADHESLLARSRSQVDGAVPSGNSVSAVNLVYLARETGQQEYRQRAAKTIAAAAGLLRSAPAAAPNMAVAVADLLELKPGSKAGTGR